MFSQQKKPVVLAKLPNAGMGNLLFVWAKAMLFAELNGLPFHILGWGQFRIGPWLRGEKSKRYYGDYFRNDASVLQSLLLRNAFGRASASPKLLNPAVEKQSAEALSKYEWVIFDEIPSWKDYFEDIKPYRELVKKRLYEMLRPTVREKLERYTPPVVGVHVRLGDFRKLAQHEDFSKVGTVRTPQQYFREMIQRIRETKGAALPVTVFSDGHPNELEEILQLPGVQLAPDNSDIVDLLLLSRSRAIVTSAGSTFGYWAGFLSDAPVVMHPDHLHGSLRTPDDNAKYFEGALQTPLSPIFIDNIKHIN